MESKRQLEKCSDGQTLGLDHRPGADPAGEMPAHQHTLHWQGHWASPHLRWLQQLPWSDTKGLLGTFCSADITRAEMGFIPTLISACRTGRGESMLLALPHRVFGSGVFSPLLLFLLFLENLGEKEGNG